MDDDMNSGFGSITRNDYDDFLLRLAHNMTIWLAFAVHSHDIHYWLDLLYILLHIILAYFAVHTST